MEDQIAEIERVDGVRLPYNVIPPTVPEHFPVSFIYSPLVEAPIVDFPPIVCSKCRAFLNGFCSVDPSKRVWVCVFCSQRNVLTDSEMQSMNAAIQTIQRSDLLHTQGNQQNQSDSLQNNRVSLLGLSTVEHRISTFSHPLLYFFVVDVCFFDDLRRALFVDAVSLAFDMLPENALVCFLTFGTNISLIDFDVTYLFSGSKTYTKEDILKFFEKDLDKVPGLKISDILIRKFFKRKQDVKVNLKGDLQGSHSVGSDMDGKPFVRDSKLGYSHSTDRRDAYSGADESFLSAFKPLTAPLDVSFLRPDPFPVSDGMRPLRCTGAALSFASSLLAATNVSSRLFLFVNGPCTYGEGAICSIPLKEPLRSFTDILCGKTSHAKSASSFYNSLATSFVTARCCVDLFAASVEDFGLFEMRPLFERTGGFVCMAQDFDRKVLCSSVIKHLKSDSIDYSNIRNIKSFYTALKEYQYRRLPKDQGNYGLLDGSPSTTDTTLLNGNIIGAESSEEQRGTSMGINPIEGSSSNKQTLSNTSPDGSALNHLEGNSSIFRQSSCLREEDEEWSIASKHTAEFTFDARNAIFQSKPAQHRSDAIFSISTTDNCKVRGILGCEQTSSGWRLPGVSDLTTLTVVLETVKSQKNTVIIQIRTITKTTIRTTTFARALTADSDKIAAGFDAGAAFTVHARSIASSQIEHDADAIRRTDRALVRFTRRFAYKNSLNTDNRTDSSINNQPNFSTNQSLIKLPTEMEILARLIYSLRRSPLLNGTSCSPDEGAYHRILATRPVKDTLKTFAPTLKTYHYQQGIKPEQLDSKAINHESILLLDTFTHVVVWKGKHFQEWINTGLLKKPEYKILNDIANKVISDARQTILSRKPTPFFVVTAQGESQERLLLSRVNPNKAGARISTDDIDYDTFYNCLAKIVTDS